MGRLFQKNRILLTLLLIGFFSVIVVLAGRVKTEQQGKNYDLILDFKSTYEMYRQSDCSLDEWLDLFYNSGISCISLPERSIWTLLELEDAPIQLLSVSEITHWYQWEKHYPDSVVDLIKDAKEKSDYLVICKELSTFKWILDGYGTRAKECDIKSIFEDNTGFILIRESAGLSASEWCSLCLGLWEPEYDLLVSHGFQIIPRTTPLKDHNGDAVLEGFLESIKKANSPYYMCLGQTEIIGAEAKDLSGLPEYIKLHHMTVLALESSNQLGVDGGLAMKDLIRSADGRAVRLFNFWQYVQNKNEAYGYSGPEEVINSVFRAVYERSCRAVLVKPLVDVQNPEIYITNPEVYKTMIDGVQFRLSEKGYNQGIVQPLPPYEPPIALNLLIGLGVIAASVLLLEQLIRLRKKLKIGLLAVGCIAVAVTIVVDPYYASLLISIGAGIAFAGLSGVVMCDFLRKTPVDHYMVVVKYFLCTTVISFIGGLFVAAALSNYEYMLELRIYRGVKIMQVIPVFLFVLCYFKSLAEQKYSIQIQRYRNLDKKCRKQFRQEKLAEIANRDVKVKQVLYGFSVVVILILMGIIWKYYISRTGNVTNISGFEIRTRNALETYLTARPRTKEFLIGYPCLMLYLISILAKRRDIPVVFGVFAMIGMTSVINTFLHIHTYLMLSVTRIIVGLILGMVLCLVLVVIIKATSTALERMLKKHV